VQQVQQSIASAEATETPNRAISLRILNGTTVNGLAARTRSLYEGYGFDVVSIGNAERQDHTETVVVGHSGDSRVVEQVAEIIRADRTVQRSPAGDANDADVTIILGEDFDGTYVR
jgi:hypothetical protein